MENNKATKRTINKCKIPYMREQHVICKNVLLYTIYKPFVVLEIIIS